MGIYLSSPNTAKTFDQAASNGLRVVSAEMQGWRKYMEDAKLLHISQHHDKFPSLFAVFDGHGGLEVSNLASQTFLQLFQPEFVKHSDIKKALHSTFLKFDEYLKTQDAARKVEAIRKEKLMDDTRVEVPQSGSTACVVAIYKGVVVCANAGDSRAFIAYKGGFKQLSFDHKPENPEERERIQAAGGVISAKRIDNGLNLSRALGDLMYKSNQTLPPQRQKVIAVPDFVEHTLTGEEQFIFIGCDGVWQKFVQNTEGMVRWVHELRRKESGKGVLQKMLEQCLSPTINETGCDNMTAVLVQFDK